VAGAVKERALVGRLTPYGAKSRIKPVGKRSGYGHAANPKRCGPGQGQSLYMLRSHSVHLPLYLHELCGGNLTAPGYEGDVYDVLGGDVAFGYIVESGSYA